MTTFAGPTGPGPATAPRAGASRDRPARRSVAEHRERAVALVTASARGVRTLRLAACLGRSLARAVHADGDLPAFDNSAMDGYAVRAADLPLAPACGGLPVRAHIPAGCAGPPALEPGTAHRIMTGAPLPAGADTVVPVEATDGGRAVVRFRGPPPVQRHVRRRGEDIARGAVVLPAGVLLGPQHLAAAAAAGASTLPVRRPLRVGVLSAGSELVAAGAARRAGQVHDTNGVLLAAAVTEAGAHAVGLPTVTDDPDELSALLTAQLPGLDVLVTSGGISAGDHEVVKDVAGPRGVWFGPVALKPGGAQGLGSLDGVPVLALPGNPVACWVSFELFVRPALRAACGLPPDRPRRTVRTAARLRWRAGRREYLPAVLDRAGTVRPVEAAGPHSYRALAGASCLIELDESGRGAEPGQPVTVLDLTAAG